MLLLLFSFFRHGASKNRYTYLNNHFKYSSETESTDHNPNIKWKINQKKNILIIYGTGHMNNYSKSNPAPWNSFSESIEIIRITNDIKSIGSYSFYNFKSIKQVKFSNKITLIGENSFAFCSQIESLIIPPTVSLIQSNAFLSCTSLKQVTFMGENEPKFGLNVFGDCNSLSYISVTHFSQNRSFANKEIRRISVSLLNEDSYTSTDIPTPTEIPYPTYEGKMENKKVPMIVAFTLEFAAVAVVLIILYIFSKRNRIREPELCLSDNLMSQSSLI